MILDELLGSPFSIRFFEPSLVTLSPGISSYWSNGVLGCLHIKVAEGLLSRERGSREGLI
jgi:hypothetical protein